MTGAPYVIAIDQQRRFVEITLRGLWTYETSMRFEADLRRSLRVLPASCCPLGTQVTLFDLTEFVVQVKEVSAVFAGLAADPTIASRRIALLVSAPLLALQAKRVAPDYRAFTRRDEAMRWLFAQDD